MKKDYASMSESEQMRYNYLRDRYLKKNFGIDIMQYDSQFAKQEGKCLICEKTSDVLLYVDVSKSSVKRGLLCNRCRLGISYFNDDIELMQKAIAHITKFLDK